MSDLILPDSVNFRPAFDLNIYHRRYDHSAIVVWITWDRATGEPVMVLTPNTDRPGHERVIPCVVPLSTSWMWTEEVGDARHCATVAPIFVSNLGLNPNSPRHVYGVLSTIRGHLEDLVMCPPIPAEDRSKAAEMLITNNETETVTHREVSDYA
jgi:hypothetical protein